MESIFNVTCIFHGQVFGWQTLAVQSSVCDDVHSGAIFCSLREVIDMNESTWWNDAWSGNLYVYSENHLVMVRDTLTALLLPIGFFCLGYLYANTCGTKADNMCNEQVRYCYVYSKNICCLLTTQLYRHSSLLLKIFSSIIFCVWFFMLYLMNFINSSRSSSSTARCGR